MKCCLPPEVVSQKFANIFEFGTYNLVFSVKPNGQLASGYLPGVLRLGDGRLRALRKKPIPRSHACTSPSVVRAA